MSDGPEHISKVLARVVPVPRRFGMDQSRVRVKPMPCSPQTVKGKREDSHRFVEVDAEWQRCVRCGWYARR